MDNVHRLPIDPRVEQIIRETYSRHGGGVGGGDGDMWQQSVETRLGNLDTRIEGLRSDMNRDFRWTWGGMGLIAAMAVAGAWAIYSALSGGQQGLEQYIHEIAKDVSVLVSQSSGAASE